MVVAPLSEGLIHRQLATCLGMAVTIGVVVISSRDVAAKALLDLWRLSLFVSVALLARYKGHTDPCWFVLDQRFLRLMKV